MTTAIVPARPGATALAEIRDLADLERRAVILSKTELVPAALRGKPHDIMLIGLWGAEHGVSLVTAVSEVWILDGKPNPSAQLRLGLIGAAGHQTRWVTMSRTEAVIRGRKRQERHDPDAWTTVTYDLTDARTAGLLDRWVEKWDKIDGRNTKTTWVVGDDQGDRDLSQAPDWVQKQIAAGKVKQKDNWWKYRADMLAARAATRLSRRVFPDVLVGLGIDPHTAEEHGHDVGHDHDGQAPDDDGIEDADVVPVRPAYVDQDGVIAVPNSPGPESSPGRPAGAVDGAGGTPATEPPAPGPDPDKQALISRIGGWNRTATDTQRAELLAWRTETRIPVPDSGQLADYDTPTLQTIAAELDRRGWRGHGPEAA